MRCTSLIVLAAVTAFAGAAPGLALAATPLTGRVSVANALGLPPNFVSVRSDERYWTDLSQPYSDSFSFDHQFNLNFAGLQQMSSHSAASFDFAPDAGSAHFDLSHAYKTSTLVSGSFQGQLPDAHAFTYTFVADGDGEFALDYDIQRSSTLAFSGLFGWYFEWVPEVGPSSTLSLFSFDKEEDFAGQFTQTIEKGKTYSILLTPQSNWTNGGNLDFTASMVSDFSYRITEGQAGPGVPEPATWALMIGGFGLAGAALRRRRVVPI